LLQINEWGSRNVTSVSFHSQITVSTSAQPPFPSLPNLNPRFMCNTFCKLQIIMICPVCCWCTYLDLAIVLMKDRRIIPERMLWLYSRLDTL
jgi:hypothetical protein